MACDNQSGSNLKELISVHDDLKCHSGYLQTILSEIIALLSEWEIMVFVVATSHKHKQHLTCSVLHVTLVFVLEYVSC